MPDDVRLWPVLTALGVAAVVAAVVVVLAMHHDDAPGPDRVVSMPIARVVARSERVVRVVTVGSPCATPTRAVVGVRADVIAIRVLGDQPTGACIEISAVQCRDVRLPVAIGGRRLAPAPVAPGELGTVAPRRCPPLAVT